ncbi:MAG TPA: hypothetical protein DCR93_37250 [Cytophagales bacterium]|nr:hypothetical protein [Cytophagales bacterium]
MWDHKLFLSQGLKLEELASASDLTRHQLSRVLNEIYGHGFAHYVNSYRVRAAKELILTRAELSLEGIGYEVGFRSKSSFFESFKKHTGQTPAQFRKQQKVPVTG